MKVRRGLMFGLVFAVLAPAVAEAQRPRDTRYTRDASRHLGLAMIQADEAAREKAYQDALAVLQEGFEREATNPRIWMLAGQAYAGLLDFAGADSAFDRAVALYPDYAEEAEAEREAAWIAGFQAGVEFMDEQRMDEALRVLEGAHMLYPKRPEGLLNIGSIYASRGDTEKAEWAFEEAIKAINGPRFNDLDAEGQEQWKRYEEMSRVNIAQMRGARGVEAFQTGDYDAAIRAFTQAAETNPYSRDFLFNIAQGRFAKAEELERARGEAEPGAAPQDAELARLYEQLIADIDRVRPYDPTSENLLLIKARAIRRHGELTGDTDAANRRALTVFEELQALGAEVGDLMITPREDAAVVQGVLRNRSIEQGARVRVRVTLLGVNGETIGEGETQVAAAAPSDEEPGETNFELSIPTGGKQIAGWKYEMVK